MFDFDLILNKKADNNNLIATVVTINPLTVELIPDDNPIPVIATTNLWGISVGSRVLLQRFGKQFIAVGVIGNDYLMKCILKKTSAQTIPNATFTAITFTAGTTQYDPLSMHSETTNTSRITISKNGIYIVTVGGRWANSTDGNARLKYVYVNGSAINSIGGEFDSAGRFAGTNGITLSLESGDYVEMYVYQGSGGNLNFGDTGYSSINFSVIKI